MFCFLDIVAAAGKAVSSSSRNGTSAPPTAQVPASAFAIAAAETLVEMVMITVLFQSEISMYSQISPLLQIFKNDQKWQNF